MWNKIKDEQPTEAIQVLFREPDGWGDGGYHTGYWDEYDNCMKEYIDGQDGKTYGVDIWMYIPMEEIK
jgi:hypothetical protein